MKTNLAWLLAMLVVGAWLLWAWPVMGYTKCRSVAPAEYPCPCVAAFWC